jgi:uncharacterized glyoxalase superfamily protein PhnB
LRSAEGPTLFIAEIPEDQQPDQQVVLKVTEESLFAADSGVELETPFEDTHFGTRMAAVRDPDGRLWGLQAPASAGDTN